MNRLSSHADLDPGSLWFFLLFVVLVVLITAWTNEKPGS